MANLENREVEQYRTIKRLNKIYLVRCAEDGIKGNGIRPHSAIARCERELEHLRSILGLLIEKGILLDHNPNSKKRAQEIQRQQISAARSQIQATIRTKERELLELQIY